MTRAPLLSAPVMMRACALGITIGIILGGCVRGETPSIATPLRHTHHRAPPSRLVSLATEIADAEHIVPETALALVQVESGFNPNARSSAGAIGLTQIKCATARGIGYVGSCINLYEPRTNLTYGLRYLRGNLDQENGHECRALGLYFSGRAGAPNWHYCHLVQSAKPEFTGE